MNFSVSQQVKRLVLGVLFCLPLISFSTTFKEGRDYKKIAVSKTESGKSLIEFFSYGCPFCFELEPSVEKLAASLPKGVHFKRVPVTFEPNWNLYAKAYYTATTLHMEQKLTPMIFNAIQKEDKLQTTEDMINFFVAQGANEKFVKSAFLASPTMNALVKRSTLLMQQYHVYAVPTFVINEEYKTDLAMLKGDKEKLLAVVNYLINLKE